MPPEDTAVIEPPKTEPKAPSFGDKFRAEFAKIEPPKNEAPPPTSPEPKVEAPAPKTEPEPKKEEAPVSKPSSPLDDLLGKETPTEKPVEAPDVLKEFDETKPNWTRAREVMKTQSGRIKEYETEISKLKSEPKVDNGAVAQLTQERDQLKEQNVKYQNDIKAINAEYSDDYQALIKDRENVLTKIGNRVKAYGGDPDIVLAALALPEGKVKTTQIKEALGELDPDDKARVHNLIEGLEGTNEKIEDFRKDLPAKWDDIQARRDTHLREQETQNLKTLETQFGKIVDELPKNTVTLREVSDDIPGAAEWNSEVKASREAALIALKPNGTDFNQTVALAVKGARYDSLEKRYLQLHSDYSEAMGRLKDFDAAGPDFKGGKKPTTEPAKTHAQRYKDNLQKLQSVEE